MIDELSKGWVKRYLRCMLANSKFQRIFEPDSEVFSRYI
jgi:hypothetical protein